MASFSQSQQDAGGILNTGERKGMGEVRFTGIEFLDFEGQPQPFTRTGDSLTVRLHYAVSHPVQEVEFGISLWAGLGTLVSALSTLTTGFEVPPLPAGEGSIEITLDALNLIPGRYSVSLWVTGPNHYGRPEYCYDVVEHCAELDLEPSDFYKTGKGVHRDFGIVVLPCRWRLGTELRQEASGEFCARAQN